MNSIHPICLLVTHQTVRAACYRVKLENLYLGHRMAVTPQWKPRCFRVCTQTEKNCPEKVVLGTVGVVSLNHDDDRSFDHVCYWSHDDRGPVTLTKCFALLNLTKPLPLHRGRTGLWHHALWFQISESIHSQSKSFPTVLSHFLLSLLMLFNPLSVITT